MDDKVSYIFSDFSDSDYIFILCLCSKNMSLLHQMMIVINNEPHYACINDTLIGFDQHVIKQVIRLTRHIGISTLTAWSQKVSEGIS